MAICAHASQDITIDRTPLVDVWRGQNTVTYTNTSDRFLWCQLSTHNPHNAQHANLPLGTLAEKKNIPLRPFLSYTNRRIGHQVIFCVDNPLPADPP